MGRYITGVLLVLSLGGLLYFTVPKCLPQIERLSNEMAAGEERTFYVAENKKDLSVIYRINELGLVSGVFFEAYQKDSGRIEKITYQNGLYYLVRESEKENQAVYVLYRIAAGSEQAELTARLELNSKETVADMAVKGNQLYLTSIGEDKCSAFVYCLDLEAGDKKNELLYEVYPKNSEVLTDAAYAEDRVYILTKEGRLSYFEGERPETERDTEEGCISWIKGSSSGLICMGFEERRLYCYAGSGRTDVEQGVFYSAADRAADKRMVLFGQEENGSFTLKTYQDKKWRFLKTLSCTFPVFLRLAGRTVFMETAFVLLAGVFIFFFLKRRKKTKSIKKRILAAFVIGTAVPVLAVFTCAVLNVKTSMIREIRGIAEYYAATVTEALSSVELTKINASAFDQTPLYDKSCKILEETQTKQFPSETVLVYSNNGERYVLAANHRTFGCGLSGIFPEKIQQAVSQAEKEGSSQIIRLDWNDKKWIFTVTPEDNRVRPEVFLLAGMSIEDLHTERRAGLCFCFLLLLGGILFSGLMGAAAMACYKKPLKILSKELQRAGTGNTELENGVLGEEEFKEIRNSLLQLGSIVRKQQDRGIDIKSLCARFVPQGMERLMGKKALSEVLPGDRTLLTGTFALLLTKVPEELQDNKKNAACLERMNRLYTVMEEKKKENGGVLLTNDSRLNRVTLFYSQPEAAYCFGTEMLREVLTEETKADGFPVFLMLHYAACSYGLAGTSSHAFPFLKSKELEIIEKTAKKLSDHGIRMVLTETVKQSVEKNKACRYIGYIMLEEAALPCHLYEVLEVYGEAERKAKIKTNRKFQKGLTLFYRSDFYLARSCFAEILKQFPTDTIAAWYLFRCENLFQMEGSTEVLFPLFAE